MAIACGALVKRDLSARSAVWAELSVADSAAYEFAQVLANIIVPIN